MSVDRVLQTACHCKQLNQEVAYSMELNERSKVSNNVKLAMAAGTVPVKELLPSCRPCKTSVLLSDWSSMHN